MTEILYSESLEFHSLQFLLLLMWPGVNWKFNAVTNNMKVYFGR